MNCFLVSRSIFARVAAVGAFGVAACGSPDPGPVGGTGTVSGVIDARSFDAVGASYVIGKPDDPARTIVIYVFDGAVGCGEISSAGWDEAIANGTQALELKLIGLAPAAYPVATDGRPSAGQSDVNYTVAASTPSEVLATAGTVTLTAIDGTTTATGTFDLTFAGGSVAGGFDAVGCANGREP